MGGESLRYHHDSIDLSDHNSPYTHLILLTGRDKRVLEVGPATGYVTRVLQERGCRVTGIEKDPVAAQIASSFAERMIVGDVEALDFTDALAGQRFDVVMFGDVLEHLVDPQDVLLRTARVLRPKGYVVASIPNIAHGSIRLALLAGDFRYTDLGLLDRTHLRFFTAESLERMFRDAGYTIRVWRRILMDPFNTELHLSAAEYPASVAASLQKDVDAMTYQFIVKAHVVSRPRGSARKAVPSSKEPAPVLHTLRQLEAEGQRLGVQVRGLAAETQRLNAETQRLDAETRRLNAETQRLEVEKRGLDHALARTTTLLTEKEAALVERELALGQATQQLDAIRQKASYRLLERIRRLLGRIAPPGTLRGRFHAGVLGGVAFFADHGFVASSARMVQVWKWAPRLLRGRSPGLPREPLSPAGLAGGARSIPARPAGTDSNKTLDEQYQRWLEVHGWRPRDRGALEKAAKQLSYRPKVSLVMSVDEADPAYVRATTDSLAVQIYEKWELCIAHAGPAEAAPAAALEQAAARDERIRVVPVGDSERAHAAASAALSSATGEFVGFLHSGDELRPDALYRMVRCLNEQGSLDVVYSDEDQRLPDGRLGRPFFKPEWSPDLLLSVDYLTRLALYRRQLVDEVGGLSSDASVSAYYDLALRITERTECIGHVGLPLHTSRTTVTSSRDAHPPADVARMTSAGDAFAYAPLLSLVVVLRNPNKTWLDKVVESVRAQAYARWELCLVEEGPVEPWLAPALERHAERDRRIRVVHAGEGATTEGIARALRLSAGEFLGLLDPAHELAPDALYEVVARLNEAPDLDLLYSDGDLIDANGRRLAPLFKPDWNPDLRLGTNCIADFVVLRRSVLQEIDGSCSALEGPARNDVPFRLTERTQKIGHIPKILYHRRMPASADAGPEGGERSFDSPRAASERRAIEEALRRRGYQGWVERVRPGISIARYSLRDSPLVSIIIPTRDRHALLEACVRSIEDKTSYSRFEIIVLDNDSADPATLQYLDTLAGRWPVQRCPGPFNFSAINNLGARQASGEYLLFLNNDTEVIRPDWLSGMLEHAQRPEVGAVGAKLLYPDRRIQHAGVVLGIGLAGHAFKGVPDNGQSYFGFADRVRNCSAVTAACMMVSRRTFEAVGGFDERLKVAFNDLDLCMRLRQRGFLIVWTPVALLYHHETVSRPQLHPEDDAVCWRRWGDVIRSGDPYYSPHLTLEREDWSLGPVGRSVKWAL